MTAEGQPALMGSVIDSGILGNPQPRVVCGEAAGSGSRVSVDENSGLLSSGSNPDHCSNVSSRSAVSAMMLSQDVPVSDESVVPVVRSTVQLK